MSRKSWVAISALVVVVVILASALAHVGSQLDEVRIDNHALKGKLGTAQGQVSHLTGERNTLQARQTEQIMTAEQLKAEVNRTQGKVEQLKAALEEARTQVSALQEQALGEEAPSMSSTR